MAQSALAPLDPDKNISISLERPSLKVSPVPDDDDYSPGRHHKRFMAASTGGSWGFEWGRCGKGVVACISGETLLLRPLLCGTWACDLCGVRRAAWLKEQVQTAQPRDGLSQFWTLTCWTESCTPQESFPLLKRAWNQCRTNIVRDEGKFRFIWTVEPTKAGYAHLHLLTDLALPVGDLSERWETATGGSYIVDAASVRSARAADYLAKYCTAQARLRKEAGWEHLKYSRVFSKSRSVAFTPFRQPGEGWAMLPLPYWGVAKHVREGLSVEREQVAGVPMIEAKVGPTGDDLTRYLLAVASGAGADGAVAPAATSRSKASCSPARLPLSTNARDATGVPGGAVVPLHA